MSYFSPIFTMNTYFTIKWTIGHPHHFKLLNNRVIYVLDGRFFGLPKRQILMTWNVLPSLRTFKILGGNPSFIIILWIKWFLCPPSSPPSHPPIRQLKKNSNLISFSTNVDCLCWSDYVVRFNLCQHDIKLKRPKKV